MLVVAVPGPLGQGAAPVRAGAWRAEAQDWCVCVCMHVCLYLCVHVCAHTRVCVSVRVCIHFCSCVCTRVHVGHP